jgi:hypothetical protein
VTNITFTLDRLLGYLNEKNEEINENMPHRARKSSTASPGILVRLPHNADIPNIILASDGQRPAII